MKYVVYAGTNSIEECWLAVKGFLRGQKRTNHYDPIGMYENSFSKSVNAKEAISFGAGRMALYALLEAMAIGKGDEVILPAFTCVVVPNAIIYRGAKPVYVDIDPTNFNLKESAIEAAITDKTKAIIAQHTFGVACNILRIIKLARKHDIFVLEDCGHAQGAVDFNGTPVGQLSDASFYTTDHSKIMSTFLGGMVTTNFHDLASRVRTIQNKSRFPSRWQSVRMLITFIAEVIFYSPRNARIGRYGMSILNKLSLSFYWRDELNIKKPAYYPARLLPWQACVGLSQLRRMPENLGCRRRIADMLEDQIGWYGYDGGQLNRSSWLRYSFLVDDRRAFEDRFSEHWDLAVWFTTVMAGRFERFDEIGYQEGSCPVAEFAARHIVNFPTHPRVSFKVLAQDVEKNKGWIRQQLIRYPQA